jgi:DNA polymerase III subunit alpha
LHPGLKDYNLMQRCLAEQRLLGYMLSGNPLDVLGLHPAYRDAIPASEIHEYAGRRVKVFGLYVTARQHRVAKSGRLMEFLTLEDMSGNVDVVFWPKVLERYEDELTEPGPFEVWGKVTEEWDTFTLEAESIRPVLFIPNLVDFELASERLREGTEAMQHADLRTAKIA